MFALMTIWLGSVAGNFQAKDDTTWVRIPSLALTLCCAPDTLVESEAPFQKQFDQKAAAGQDIAAHALSLSQS